MDRSFSERAVARRPRRHTDRRHRPRFEKKILLGECPVPARVPPDPASGSGTFPAKSDENGRRSRLSGRASNLQQLLGAPQSQTVASFPCAP
jgi:hypothetical protein